MGVSSADRGSTPTPALPRSTRGGGKSESACWPGVLGIAIVWTATEWVRGIIFTGLPWLFLGYTQTPILPVCQIADITGAYGVTFWVTSVNALAATAWLNRDRLRVVIPAAAVVGLMTVGSLAYGLFRIGQTDRLSFARPDHRRGSIQLSADQQRGKGGENRG